MKSAAAWIEQKLGYAFRDAALLEAALTHRSAGGPHNERLEFLGDAVLNCVVARLVFREFAAANEGDLSRFRASLVSGEALAVIALELDLGSHVRLGSGELKSAKSGSNSATAAADRGTGSGASSLIDERIQSLKDWRGEMLAKVRRLIHEADPDIVEECKWAKATNPSGVPVWSHAGIICTGEMYKQVVKLTFARGAEL